MDNFKEGDLVLCVDDSECGSDKPIIKGKYYRVAKDEINQHINCVVIINEHGFEDDFYSNRFISVFKHRNDVISDILL